MPDGEISAKKTRGKPAARRRSASEPDRDTETVVPATDPIRVRQSRERLRAQLQRKNHAPAGGTARNWIRS